MEEPKDDIKLTPKQKRFCEEYMVDLNASAAAIRAGYSEKTCAEIGYENLRKPQIRAYLDAQLQEKSLGAEETTKLISDIARGSLNDYFVVKQVERHTTIDKPLAELITEIEAEIDFEEEYASLASLSERELLNHMANQESRRKQILRYKLKLKRDPGATEKVPGPMELVEVAELDMVKLVNDKERGRIKSITETRYGINVEMYAADAALRDIAKMHGNFEKHNKQKTDLRLSVDMSKEEAATILEALKDKI